MAPPANANNNCRNVKEAAVVVYHCAAYMHDWEVEGRHIDSPNKEGVERNCGM